MNLDTIYNMDYLEGMKMIPDGMVDLIVTDPPYLFVKGGMKSNSINCGTKASDNYINTDMSDYGEKEINTLLDVVSKKFKNQFNGYFFCSEMQVVYYLQYALRNRLKYNLLVWDRGISNMISYKFFRSHIDYIVRIYGKGNALRKVISDRPTDMYSKIKRGVRPKGLHVAAKPLEIISDFILISSQENDIVLDPFMGSGTTAIACIKEHRHFIGFELNKDYYDKAQQRIEYELKQLTLF